MNPLTNMAPATRDKLLALWVELGSCLFDIGSEKQAPKAKEKAAPAQIITAEKGEISETIHVPVPIVDRMRVLFREGRTPKDTYDTLHRESGPLDFTTRHVKSIFEQWSAAEPKTPT